MCLLIVLNGVDADHPIIVASNRDELRSRLAAPPGLHVGERRRMLAPRDRLAGGTWMGVNDRGLFAGLTNMATAPEVTSERSRGLLPHLALDQDDMAASVAAIAAEVVRACYAGFQMLLADGTEARVLVHRGGQLEVSAHAKGALVLSNEHRLGELELPLLGKALGELEIEHRFAILREILLDEGDQSGHRILKKGGDYGTVSSSLLAVDPRNHTALTWLYADGSPDECAYREYGNLARRLSGE